jgi:hypothetical protein
MVLILNIGHVTYPMFGKHEKGLESYQLDMMFKKH